MLYKKICEIILIKKANLDRINEIAKYVYLGKEEFEVIKKELKLPKEHINTPFVDTFFGLGLCVVNVKSFVSVGI